MNQVKIMARSQGLLIHQYLDDWLLRSKDRQVLIRQTAWMQKQCAILGLKVNLEKSEIVPKQDHFVGYMYHAVTHKVFPTKERIENINRPKQGKDMAVIDGTPECHREISACGETPFKRDSVLSSQSVESGRQRSPCKGLPVRVSKACSPVVVFPTQFRKGFSDSNHTIWCILMPQ